MVGVYEVDLFDGLFHRVEKFRRPHKSVDDFGECGYYRGDGAGQKYGKPTKNTQQAEINGYFSFDRSSASKTYFKNK